MGLFSISIFSKCLNWLIESKFSVSCIFCFDEGFCLSLSSFLFGEESVEVSGLIKDLLSFDIVLEGDFAFGHFIGRMVDVISVFSFSSVSPGEVCVWADVFTLSAARFPNVVGTSGTLVLSSEARILLIKLSKSPGSS